MSLKLDVVVTSFQSLHTARNVNYGARPKAVEFNVAVTHRVLPALL